MAAAQFAHLCKAVVRDVAAAADPNAAAADRHVGAAAVLNAAAAAGPNAAAVDRHVVAAATGLADFVAFVADVESVFAALLRLCGFLCAAFH